MNQELSIEVWSDVQCVWCYIGDARMRKALEAFPGTVHVTHRSFELQPGAPIEFDAEEYLRSHRGMDSQAQDRAFAAMTRVASAEGLAYEPRRIRPTNSHRALELLHHAETVERRSELGDRLYRAYFAEGRHIGSIDDLVDLAAEVGIEHEGARAVLAAGTYREVVDQEAEAARSLGARGVPFMIIGDQYAVPGALGADELLQVFHRVAAR